MITHLSHSSTPSKRLSPEKMNCELKKQRNINSKDNLEAYIGRFSLVEKSDSSKKFWSKNWNFLLGTFLAKRFFLEFKDFLFDGLSIVKVDRSIFYKIDNFGI